MADPFAAMRMHVPTTPYGVHIMSKWGTTQAKTNTAGCAAALAHAANNHDDLIAALDAAESILRCLPNSTTNCMGTKPLTTTHRALELVRNALKCATGG